MVRNLPECSLLNSVIYTVIYIEKEEYYGGSPYSSLKSITKEFYHRSVLIICEDSSFKKLCIQYSVLPF